MTDRILRFGVILLYRDSNHDIYIKLQGCLVKPDIIYINNHQVPWYPMSVGDIWFSNSRVPWNIEWQSKGTRCQLNRKSQSSMAFHGTLWHVIWQRQSSMEFHGTLLSFEMAPSKFHVIPWNLVIFDKATSKIHEFHGTKWYFIWRHQSSMEFHGIFHGIPWNTCVIWNGALLIPWNHLELGNFLIWRLQSCMEFQGMFHRSPG